MAKKNYYAVKQGKVPGIYRTWDACKAQVHGYPGAIYKGFERLEEAEAFLGGGKMPEPLLRETKGTYSAAPERKAVQSTAAPDPSSLDWEHLILAEKPCEDPEYAGVGRSAVAYVDGSYQQRSESSPRCGPLPGRKRAESCRRIQRSGSRLHAECGRRDQGRRAGHGLLPDT